MREKKLGNIFAVWILAVLTLVSVCLTSGAVQAAGQVGSIEMQLPSDSGNAEISIFAVGGYENGGFVFTGEFADCKAEINDLNNAQQVQAAEKVLKDFVKERGLTGTAVKPDSQGKVRFTGLAPALYLMVQTAGETDISVQSVLVPIPHTGEGGAAVYDAVILPKYEYPGGDTLVTKLDDEGYVLAGAAFDLQQKIYLGETNVLPEGAEQGSDDKGTYYWEEYVTNLVSNENGQIVIRDMPRGDYRLVEVKAPEGFIKSVEPTYFSVDSFGKVTEQDGVYVPDQGSVTEVSVTNTPTSLVVEKVDPDGNRLPGAKLMVKNADGGMILDADGNPLYVFTSAEEPAVLKRLPAGEYLVTELVAPEGFRISPDVAVTVSDAVDAENHVIITDEKEETTKYSITVEKALTDLEGMPVFARDGVFYVALFADEGHTQRVSSVLPISFHGESSSTVTFENLAAGTVYYLGETDEFGNYIDGDLEGGENNTFYVPLYPDDTSVTVDEETGTSRYSFENVFLELPDGFYYHGEITVTKKVRKGTEEYNTDEVFYCAVFRDEECTNRMGDVVELAMDGGSETSVTIPIDIGDSRDQVFNYYIRETDKNGIPLENTGELDFTVKQDKEMVTLSYIDSQDEVVITNTYGEETPSITPAVTERPGTTPGTAPGSNPPSSSHQGPRTLDNTNIALYVIILLIAAVAGVAAAVIKQKK